ncbi:uncharacterized protein BP01DRAFT_389622, partial [Aspergillus saccharolyticus JOP 1030-1]
STRASVRRRLIASRVLYCFILFLLLSPIRQVQPTLLHYLFNSFSLHFKSSLLGQLESPNISHIRSLAT